MDEAERQIAKELPHIRVGLGQHRTKSFIDAMWNAAQGAGENVFIHEDETDEWCPFPTGFVITEVSLSVLSERQSHWLMALCWRYRKQMPAHLVMIAAMRLGGNPKCKFEDRGTASLPMMG